MNASSEAEHMPQLDALRAFAFVGVAVSHWTPNFLAGIVPWGTGVLLFFVLSGFLITGILLRSRPSDLGLSMSGVLRVFYLRRFLRIFPLYYGVLALALVFAVGPIFTMWPWHVSYLSNFHYAWHGHDDALTDPFLHFWSLAVEEQFYVIWPLIVLTASRRALPIILVSLIAGSATFRVSIAHLAPSIETVRYLTPSCFDALAVGGLIAHARHYAGPSGVRRLVRIFAGVGAVGLVVSTVALKRIIDPEDAHRVGHTFLVIVYGAIVAQAAGGFGGLLGRVLTLKPLQYVGKISYGLYVYHYFAPYVVNKLAHRWGWEATLQSLPVTLSAYAIVTAAAAVISWHLYELPINRLKTHFTYPRAGASRSILSSAAVSPISNG